MCNSTDDPGGPAGHVAGRHGRHNGHVRVATTRTAGTTGTAGAAGTAGTAGTTAPCGSPRPVSCAHGRHNGHGRRGRHHRPAQQARPARPAQRARPAHRAPAARLSCSGCPPQTTFGATVTTFDELVQGLFADLFRASPVFATWIGNHDHDGEWPDLTEAGSRALVDLVDRWTEAFAALPPAALTPDEAVDRDIVVGELAAMRFSETELRAEAWDPLAWVYLLGDGIHLLLAREFAPLGVRLASAAARIEGIPDGPRRGPRRGWSACRAGRSAACTRRSPSRSSPGSATSAGRPSPPPPAPTRRASWRPCGPAWSRPPPRPRPPWRRSHAHLRDVVLPASRGRRPPGAATSSRAKLRHTLRIEMTPDELEARARREFDAVGAEMVRLARELWPALRPGERAARRSDAALVRRALDTIAERHQAPDGLLDFCREELAPRRGLLPRTRRHRPRRRAAGDRAGRPSSCARSAGRCSAHPGPLDRGLRSYFYVTPPPDDWTPEQVESYLREDNDRMLRHARDPRGRARPLPPAGLRRTGRRRSSGPPSAPASSPRAGPST